MYRIGNSGMYALKFRVASFYLWNFHSFGRYFQLLWFKDQSGNPFHFHQLPQQDEYFINVFMNVLQNVLI